MAIFRAGCLKFDFTSIEGKIDLVAGGPPCQPFSIGGKHRGQEDQRNMFPQVLRAIRELKPRAVLVENVKGLMRQSFAEYFEYIILQMTYPEVVRKEDENWTEHLSRLERHHTGGVVRGLHYKVLFRLVNAADYGVPQKRERAFIVAFRSDVEKKWSFPDHTHSLDSLLWSQWISEEYRDRHEIPKKQRVLPPQKLASRIERMKSKIFAPRSRPWSTVRDAICDLPDPESGDCSVLNHKFNPGARIYTGHTGSPLDEPAKTLKAGAHGVRVVKTCLSRREVPFAILPCASAQTANIPGQFHFQGSWTEAMRQLGNAFR